MIDLCHKLITKTIFCRKNLLESFNYYVFVIKKQNFRCEMNRIDIYYANIQNVHYLVGRSNISKEKEEHY